jgi:hypothetical protein
MRFLLIALLMLLALSASLAGPRPLDSPYFPLAEGNWWEYVGDEGDSALVWVAGVQEVQGQITTVLHWQYSGEAHDYLEQYYTIAPDGAVLFHGFSVVPAGLTISYDPPFVLLPALLGLGNQWCSTTQAYRDLTGTVPDGPPFQVCFMVYSVDQLHVPAGDFSAFGIGQTSPPVVLGLVAGRDVMGRLASRNRSYATDWYAVGVGEIALRIYQYFELLSWAQPPTPASRTTWGAMKANFR